MPQVTTIIPTMAEEKRRHSLMRAIDSIVAASSKPIQIIVVVNGNRRSPAVINSLRDICNVEVLSLENASLPLALLAGRRAVDTPYYCFLDDDDEYLPGGLDLRAAALDANDSLDLVISNGYRCISGRDLACFNGLDQVSSSPFDALFQQNWLASCGSLFRSDRVGIEYFEDPHAYVEWTWLAFKLCLGEKNVEVINRPTFRINDTPDSASKSPAYANAIKALYQRMLESKPPKRIVSIVRSRLGASLHCEADSFRQKGMLLNAWRAHLRSLGYPGGWRYLPFSRHLCFINHRAPEKKGVDGPGN